MAPDSSLAAIIITPPPSFINAPPTPPHTVDSKPSAHVAKILHTFRDCKNGTLIPGSAWRLFTLRSDEEYADLLDRLSREELRDFIRHDYDPIRRKLILRMPAILHNTFITKLQNEIDWRLKRLPDNEPTTRLLIDRIEPLSGVIEIPVFDEERQRNIRREPDIMFCHKDAAWPSPVIEVSHSQKRKDLRLLILVAKARFERTRNDAVKQR